MKRSIQLSCLGLLSIALSFACSSGDGDIPMTSSSVGGVSSQAGNHSSPAAGGGNIDGGTLGQAGVNSGASGGGSAGATNASGAAGTDSNSGGSSGAGGTAGAGGTSGTSGTAGEGGEPVNPPRIEANPACDSGEYFNRIVGSSVTCHSCGSKKAYARVTDIRSVEASQCLSSNGGSGVGNLELSRDKGQILLTHSLTVAATGRGVTDFDLITTLTGDALKVESPLFAEGASHCLEVYYLIECFPDSIASVQHCAKVGADEYCSDVKSVN